MKAIYFFVTSLKDYKRCDWDLFINYFDKGNGFLTAFLIAVGISLVFALFYYVVLGRKFSTSKVGYWFVCLALSGLVSFGTTATIADAGLKNEISVIKRDKIRNGADKSEVEKVEKKLKKETKFTKCNVTQDIAIENLFFSLLFFYVFSLVFKHEPVTKYATEIPHKKP